MDFLNQASTVLQMGFIYAIVALGVYITYKILDFPRSVGGTGTFPLGGVVFAVLVTNGCPWFLGNARFLRFGLCGGIW